MNGVRESERERRGRLNQPAACIQETSGNWADKAMLAGKDSRCAVGALTCYIIDTSEPFTSVTYIAYMLNLK